MIRLIGYPIRGWTALLVEPAAIVNRAVVRPVVTPTPIAVLPIGLETPSIIRLVHIVDKIIVKDPGEIVEL
jgi:hypothetical protein